MNSSLGCLTAIVEYKTFQRQDMFKLMMGSLTTPFTAYTTLRQGSFAKYDQESLTGFKNFEGTNAVLKSFGIFWILLRTECFELTQMTV